MKYTTIIKNIIYIRVTIDRYLVAYKLKLINRVVLLKVLLCTPVNIVK